MQKPPLSLFFLLTHPLQYILKLSKLNVRFHTSRTNEYNFNYLVFALFTPHLLEKPFFHKIH